MGINTQDVISNPDENQGDIVDQITGLYSGSGYASNNVTSLSPKLINGEALNVGYSYTSLEGERKEIISGVDNNMRIGWVLSTNNNRSNSNANYWFYIDEIKVQIVK